MNRLPAGVDRKTVKETLQKLNTWKGKRSVQKLLRDYTHGSKAQLEAASFVVELVKDTDEKDLSLGNRIKPVSLSSTAKLNEPKN